MKIIKPTKPKNTNPDGEPLQATPRLIVAPKSLVRKIRKGKGKK